MLSDFAENKKTVCIKLQKLFLRNQLVTVQICLSGFNLIILKSRLDKELKHSYFSFCSFNVRLKK